jgi:hypothetical protein
MSRRKIVSVLVALGIMGGALGVLGPNIADAEYPYFWANGVTSTSFSMLWKPYEYPSDGGSPIVGYSMLYRVDGGTWTGYRIAAYWWFDSGSNTWHQFDPQTSTITGLSPSTTYEVKIYSCLASVWTPGHVPPASVNWTFSEWLWGMDTGPLHVTTSTPVPPPQPQPQPPGPGGSCPYAYSWNGQEYVKDNSLMMVCEDSSWDGQNVVDCYKLSNNVPYATDEESFQYKLQINEIDSKELTYVDKLELIAIDHEPGCSVYMNAVGDILSYQNPTAPISCIDKNGTSVIEQITARDNNSYEGFTNDTLTATFSMPTGPSAKLIINSDMKKPCGQIPWTQSYTGPIDVDIWTVDGWQLIGTINPRQLWADDVFDISGYISDMPTLEIKLTWNSHHKVDFIGLDISETVPVQTIQMNLQDAFLSTTSADVTNEISDVDETYVSISYTNFIEVAYTCAPPEPSLERTLFVRITGLYLGLDILSNIHIVTWQDFELKCQIAGKIGNSVKCTISDNSVATTSITLTRTNGQPNVAFLPFDFRQGHSYTIDISYQTYNNGANPVSVWLTSPGHEELIIREALNHKWQSVGYNLDNEINTMRETYITYTYKLVEDFEIPGYSLTDYSWSFGDGTYATIEMPTHTYANHGDYYISVIAKYTNESHSYYIEVSTYTVISI